MYVVTSKQGNVIGNGMSVVESLRSAYEAYHVVMYDPDMTFEKFVNTFPYEVYSVSEKAYQYIEDTPAVNINSDMFKIVNGVTCLNDE